jgi:hypothetical protein
MFYISLFSNRHHRRHSHTIRLPSSHHYQRRCERQYRAEALTSVKDISTQTVIPQLQLTWDRRETHQKR